jgi:hypothetical protein
MTSTGRVHAVLVLGLLPLAACGVLDEIGGGGDELTSVAGVEHTIDFDSFVDVAPGASDDDVRAAMHRQLKSALGALREQGIGVADRDAQRNLAGAVIVRTPLAVVDETGAVVGQVERVRFHYRDAALVEKKHTPVSTIELTLLHGDYVARFAELAPACSDDPSSQDAGSLWYHFAPRRWSCRTKIQAEKSAIDAATAELAAPDTQVARADAERRFVSTRATLTPVAAPPTLYPEYDRLWGFAGDPSRQKLVVYAFFGVDSDETNPRDNGLVEYLRFQRTLRARFPTLRVVHTEPQAMLLDFWIDGQRVEGVTWDDVERWVIDGSGWPAVVGGDTGKRAALLAQVVGSFSERWIVWQLPVRVTRNGVARDMTVELRTFYGWEDGSPEARLHARWRYLEAFWHADVFAYTGHSHFGHGPLEPWTYGAENFPADRYQVMLVNSCLSFNYYDEDFLAMHPGGSQNLDVVVNGLAAYWSGMGAATAGYVIGLVDGGNKSWAQVLTGMRVNLPWQSGYDPMRAVNGELDNRFTPAEGAITVTPLP